MMLAKDQTDSKEQAPRMLLLVSSLCKSHILILMLCLSTYVRLALFCKNWYTAKLTQLLAIYPQLYRIHTAIFKLQRDDFLAKFCHSIILHNNNFTGGAILIFVHARFLLR